MKPWTGDCRSASELEDDRNRQRGHRRKSRPDSGTVRDRMSARAGETRHSSRWRNGSGPGAVPSLQPTSRTLGTRAIDTRLLKGGLEFAAERWQSVRTRWHCCLRYAGRQLHALGPRTAGTVVKVASTKGLAQVNHRVIEHTPGDDRYKDSTLRGVLTTLSAQAGSIGQEHLPASPDPMPMDQLHGAPNNTARRTLRPCQGTAEHRRHIIGGKYDLSRQRQVGGGNAVWTSFTAIVGRQDCNRPISRRPKEVGRKHRRKQS